MDELGELILGEKPKVAQPDLVAPKKSPMSGLNPQLQYKEPQDELGQLILGGQTTKLPEQTTKTPEQAGYLEKSLGTAQQLRKDLPGFLASTADVLASAPSAVAGTVGYLVPRALGGISRALGGRPENQLTPEEITQGAQRVAGQLAQPVGRMTGLAETQAYKQALPTKIMDTVGQFIGESADAISKKTGIPVQDVEQALNLLTVGVGIGAGKGVKAFKQTKTELGVAPQPGMVSMGAAATTNKALLDQAIAQATPEVAAQLKQVNPAELNPKALEAILEADSLEKPIKLTVGQATGDPNLISRERNTRSTSPEFIERFNEQNKALQENVNLVKEKAAPDVFAPNYVANAESAIDFVNNKIKQNQESTSQAYKALDEFGAGKIKVDSATFAKNAMDALTAKEDIDFLPPVIKSKIDAYTAGKEMNFDQYENLRTQIARETRKAQRADDGNAVHALTLVRGELEKLPLIGETEEAKALADKARATAKAEFDLVNKDSPTYNKIYADIVNGKADTKDFIQSNILRSKNTDFAKTMELFKDDPEATQHLRAGALDVIIKDSTDASGNFKPAKFRQAIENLDVNGKLLPLFGDQAQTLQKIARTGQRIEARPTGAFVNESNTAVDLAKQYANRMATQVPIVGRFVEPAQQLLQERATKKQVQQSLKPAAGAKLSDLGK